MRVLSFSSCFPSTPAPSEGIFVFDRLKAISAHASLRVVHPVACCPLMGPIRRPAGLPESEALDGLPVWHRYYPYVPGVLKRFDGWFYYRGLRRWVARRCRNWQPDILDAHFAWPDGVAVSLLARSLGLPYVITLRGTINPRKEIPCFRARMAPALRCAGAVISVSGPMAETAIEMGAAPERVHVIPNGVDAEAFQPCPRDAARLRLGLDPRRQTLVCVASLKAPKGQRDLLHAAADLASRPMIVLVGPPAAGAGYVQSLRTLAGRLGMSERLKIISAVPRQEVVDYFNAADLTVLPSHSEGCPNVLLESLACGTPPVATAVGGVAQIIRDGDNGLLAPPGNPAALAVALEQALARPWDRAQLRQSVIARSWAVVAEEVTQVFSEAISRSRHCDSGRDGEPSL
ncbi:MAG: glycosyltransferase [Planctomycetaceae bacterium]|nr:glycosyltransferase [Planctomycetaceae bacterium]